MVISQLSTIYRNCQEQYIFRRDREVKSRLETRLDPERLHYGFLSVRSHSRLYKVLLRGLAVLTYAQRFRLRMQRPYSDRVTGAAVSSGHKSYDLSGIQREARRFAHLTPSVQKMPLLKRRSGFFCTQPSVSRLRLYSAPYIIPHAKIKTI